MIRLIPTRMALLAIAALLLAGGGWMWLNDASAASLGIPGVPQGTTVTCLGNRDHVFTVNNGTPMDASTQGAIQALVGATTLTSDGRQTTQLTVRNTHTEGFVEGVGSLVITLDSSRPSPTSALTANQTGSLYPATQVMRFYPVFILNDETFTSTTSVQVVNSNVTCFPPKPGTVYVLTNSMVLRSAAGNTISLTPGKAFTIS